MYLTVSVYCKLNNNSRTKKKLKTLSISMIKCEGKKRNSGSYERRLQSGVYFKVLQFTDRSFLYTFLFLLLFCSLNLNKCDRWKRFTKANRCFIVEWIFNIESYRHKNHWAIELERIFPKNCRSKYSHSSRSNMCSRTKKKLTTTQHKNLIVDSMSNTIYHIVNQFLLRS